MPFPELEFDDGHTEHVRCPVHGFIRYSQREREVIDHWAFRRLRNIRQLALCYYVYPGATHSRFEHSLGVMEMSTRAFSILALKHEKTLVEELIQIPELKQETLKKALQVVRLLALLHDVGHAAFSHAGESALPEGKKHEDVSVYVIEKILGDLLNKIFFDGMTKLLVRILQRSPELTFLRQFVVGEMDMDRTDYLWRDSLHCGVEYGKFDFRRLIESLTVIKHPDTGRLQIGIERGGEHTFEALILARYQMNTQVYYHRVRRIYDHYLSQYLRLWAVDNYKTLDDVLKYDDLKLIVQMETDANANNERSSIANRIVNRKHHKVVYETGDSADAIKLRKAKRILNTLKNEFNTIDFWLDDNAKGSIHKLTAPGQQEESKVEDLFLVNKNGEGRLITEDSAVLEKIPREFRSVRIYADAEKNVLQRIREAASTAEKGM